MYAAVKIGGFALGIAACFLIALFIMDELSYDRYYPDGDRIYRVVKEGRDDERPFKGVDFPAPFAKALKQEFPEVEAAGRFMPHPLFGAGSSQIRRADQLQNAYEEGFTYFDQELLDILKIPMVYGDAAHALDEPNTIVISKQKADKYFPHENPVGKVMILNEDQSRPYRVGGVIEDFPANSHIHFDFLLSMKGTEFWQGEQTQWTAYNYYTYVKLRPGASAAQLQAKMELMTEKYFIPVLIKAGIKDVENVRKYFKFYLQPVTDIHLRSSDIHEKFSHSDIRFVWLFGVVACFILVIACINFINLSTAKAANRAKEVGLRKVVGSQRGGLIKQFLTESFVFSFLSILLGLLLAWVLLPYFNTLAGKALAFPWKAWWLVPIIVLSTTVIGLLAGVYPAFYLSAFRPIHVLKGQVSRGSRNAGLRGTLVVFQFTTSIMLIIGTFVVYQQMKFILNRKMGFDKDQVLLIQGTNTLGDQVYPFKKELLKLPQVKSASISDYLPVAATKRNSNSIWKEGKVTVDAPSYGQFWRVDHDYISTMGMKIVEGRNFSPDMPTDSQAVVINQTLAKDMSLGNPIGKRITNGGGVYTIIGVVEDFNFESMKDEIYGLCMVLGRSQSILSVKANTTEMPQLLQSVSSVWKRFAPHQPIRYAFLDERFASMYEDVQRMGRIFSTFSILAIIIACLGLFALSAFMAEQRGKEISIRKVLGASVTQVTALLSGDFVKLVLIAILLASPLAWWGMNKWLEGFAYRIHISWWIFLIAGLLVLFIALGTISLQTIRAALANPVKRLKAE